MRGSEPDQSGADTPRDALPPFLRGATHPASLGAGAVLESSILPFPFELALISAILVDRRWPRALALAGASVIGCLIASIALYYVGMAAYSSLGTELAEAMGLTERIQSLRDDFRTHGFWLIAALSFLPLPIQAVTLAAGSFGYPFGPFVVAIVLSRIARFFGIAWLTMAFGEKADGMMRWAGRHKWWAALISALIIAAFLYSGFSL